MTQKYEDHKDKFSNFADKRFRPYQEDCIEFIENSKAPICVIQAPTGFGKSLTSVVAGSLFKQFTYLVSSKQLQSQLQHDFPELALMKGRNNFRCMQRPDKTCADCLHTKQTPCNYKKSGCEYEIKKKWVLKSDCRLLNYSYWLFETNYIGRFSNPRPPILICDEGDMLEGLLSSFIELRISSNIMKDLGIPELPRKTAKGSKGGRVTDDDAVAIWLDWAEFAKEKVSKRLHNVRMEIEDMDKHSPNLDETLKESKRLETIDTQFGIFINNVDDTWIYDELQPRRKIFGSTHIFRPTWITEELSEKYFFSHAQRFVLMSATFPPDRILGKLLGRSQEDFDYFEVPSSFPVENRKVYLVPAGNLTHKTFDTEVPNVLKKIRKIMDFHWREKGLIHAVSYKLANLIMGLGSSRLITHDSGNREEILEYFKESNEALVLVSPSMERGVDLPDDLCRWIILAKAPFQSLGDKLTSSRVYGFGAVGNLWYQSLCAQTIVQSVGRGVRHRSDKCVTYCLDKKIVDMVLRNRSLFPKYFIEACEV